MHVPVLKKEVLKYLDPKPNENFVDCTFGEGGHAKAILEKNGPEGKVLGIEWDETQAKKISAEKPDKRLIVVCGNFANLKSIVRDHSFGQVHGILFDLGISSWHLEESGRGFTFRKDEPLDMRFSESSEFTAEDIINKYPENEIARILKEYGQERFARSIAGKIVEIRSARRITRTVQLVNAVMAATATWYHRRKPHPATKTFQALRMAVNQELENIAKALPQALDILESEGKLAVISFHSLEDKIVKNFIREQAAQRRLTILTKKPVLPSREEIKLNLRCRSARLRVAVKAEI